MSLIDRMRRLDDNAASRSVVRLSDAVGWWWNLGVGVVLLVAGPAILVSGGRRDDVYACLSFGAVAVLVGLALQAGRRRRQNKR